MPRRFEAIAAALLLVACASAAAKTAPAPAADAEAEAEAEPAGVALTVTLASEYAWRGISLSQRNPSLQLDLAFTRALGAGLAIEAGAWAYSTSYAEHPDVHVDSGVYARLAGPTGWDGIGWSLQAARYVFPQAQIWNYTELTAAIDHPAAAHTGAIGFELAYSHATDAFGTGSRGRYVQADATVRLPRGFDLKLHLGRSLYDRPELTYPSFSDMRVTVAKSVAGVDVEAGWIATSGDHFGRMGEPRWIAAVSKTF